MNLLRLFKSQAKAPRAKKTTDALGYQLLEAELHRAATDPRFGEDNKNLIKGKFLLLGVNTLSEVAVEQYPEVYQFLIKF